MSPNRRLFSSLACCLGILLLTNGCLGNDFRDLPLDVDERDHGWTIAIEPEEYFEVHLQGNAAYTEASWRIVDFDPAVIAMEDQEHEIARPAAGNPEAMEPDEYDPGSPTSQSRFTFIGLSRGETPLRFEVLGNGTPVDVVEYTVTVVDDACSADTAAVANRCGGDFSYHPQEGLIEWDHGRTVPLEPGNELLITLTSNALHPDNAWQIAAFDERIITVEGPQPLGASRAPGDFSETDPFVSHSFLPAWLFTLRGVALGESPLTLEVVADGQRVDLFEINVAVVGDAEAFDEQQSGN